MDTIRTEQRYADPEGMVPIPKERNVYANGRYVGCIRQWPDGQWCYHGREGVVDTEERAAAELVDYKALVERMPDHDNVVMVHPSDEVTETLVGIVDVTRYRVVNGTVHGFVQLIGSSDWHDVDSVQMF